MTRAEQVVNATATEFAGLTAARGSEAEAQAAATELLRRVIGTCVTPDSMRDDRRTRRERFQGTS